MSEDTVAGAEAAEQGFPFIASIKLGLHIAYGM